MYSNKTTEPARYPSFDLIRLLLALEVVVAHTWGTLIPGSGWPGFVIAVPAFLAVSGFLVLKSYSETPSWLIFARKRALRIFPALLASITLGYSLFDQQYLLNSLITWITAGIYIPEGMTNNPLWSLGWEELAYACLAILWALGAYRNPVYIWVLLALASAVSWALVRVPVTPFWQIVSFLAPAFFIGNLIFIHREKMQRLGTIAPWVFLAFVMYWGASSPAVIQAFAVVWAGMAGRNLMPFKIPDISYGMYVYHWPVLYFIAVELNIKSPLTATVLLACILIPLCLASWYFLERPALRYKRTNASTVVLPGNRPT